MPTISIGPDGDADFEALLTQLRNTYFEATRSLRAEVEQLRGQEVTYLRKSEQDAESEVSEGLRSVRFDEPASRVSSEALHVNSSVSHGKHDSTRLTFDVNPSEVQQVRKKPTQTPSCGHSTTPTTPSSSSRRLGFNHHERKRFSELLTMRSDLSSNSNSSTTAGTMFSTCRTHVRRMVGCLHWELALAIVIIINSLVMAVEVQYRGLDVGYDIGYHGCRWPAKDLWAHGQVTFDTLEWTFGMIYVAEALFKLFGLGFTYFRDYLNYVDMLAIIGFFVQRFKALTGALPLDASTIRLLRCVRLGRLLRLMRALGGFDKLHLMTTTMYGSMSILCWALVVLVVIQMIIALCVTQVLQATYFTDEHSRTDEILVYEYFGTFTRAMLSMFEMAMANWPPITRLLSEKVSEWFMLWCLLHKATVGFAVIGVINGVFIQETFKVAHTDDTIMLRNKRREQNLHHQKMTRLFKLLDRSNAGCINLAEFQRIAENVHMKTYLESMQLDTSDVAHLFSLIDVDGNGTITSEELVRGVSKLKGPARSIDMLTLLQKYMKHEPREMKVQPEWKNSRATNLDYSRLSESAELASMKSENFVDL